MDRFVATTKATQKQSSLLTFAVKVSPAFAHCHLEARDPWSSRRATPWRDS